MVPIMPSMMMRPVVVHSTKFLFLNSKRGMMGSFARRSTCTNTKAATMHSTNSPMIWNESQAYSVPPQAVASTSDAHGNGHGHHAAHVDGRTVRRGAPVS